MQYNIPDQLQQDKPLYTSIFGTPVFANIEFLAGTYQNKQGQNVNYQKVVLESFVLSLSRTKNIIMTEIPGRDGTVKEITGAGDHVISIRGVIAGANGHYPIDEVRRLKDVLDAGDVASPISVSSAFLNAMDVFFLQVTDYEFPQQEGGYSSQQFTINAISDMPAILAMTS